MGGERPRELNLSEVEEQGITQHEVTSPNGSVSDSSSTGASEGGHSWCVA